MNNMLTNHQSVDSYKSKRITSISDIQEGLEGYYEYKEKQPNPQFGEDISVHAFVDKETGEVYKPAGWKQPAKHVRFDMRDETQRARLYNICDWAGGYLYMR